MNKIKQNKKKIITVSIIGILLVAIGYFSYLFYFKNMSLFRNQEKKLLDGAKYYYELYPNKLPKEGEYSKVDIVTLYNGLFVESLYVPGKNKVCSENSYVKVINQNNEYKYITYLECGKYKSNIDKTGPEITLNGEKSLIISLNSTYEEKGVARVYDNKDKDIDINKVIITNNIDTTKMGNYKVTYKVYDSSFNYTVVERDVTVANTLNENVLLATGDGVYKGKVTNNYVLFSGMLFRIVKINEDSSIKLISENAISNLDNINGNVDKWLNEYFYNYIYNKDYIKLSDWCVDEMPNICASKLQRNVGLLTTDEFNASISEGDTYLDTGVYFLLANKYNGKTVTSESTKLVTEYGEKLLPIRPVINIKENTYAVGGDGSYNNPYMLGDYTQGKENDNLSDRLVGEYINYSGYKMIISDKTEDGLVKVTMVDILNSSGQNVVIGLNYSDKLKFDPNDKLNHGYIINNDLIDYVSDEYIKTHEFEFSYHDSQKLYSDFEKVKYEIKLSLPNSYEMFGGTLTSVKGPKAIYLLGDYSNTENNLYMINGGNGLGFELYYTQISKYALRLTMYLKADIKIQKGNGTYDNPYYLK